MRIFNRQGTWRFRSSLIVSAIISTLLVPATILLTADPASAAVGSYYCDSYSGYPIMVNDNGNGSDGDYTVSRLTISGVGHNTIHTLDLPNNASINAVGISPIDNKAYGIVGDITNGPLLARFDDDEVEYVAEVSNKATQGTFDVHGDYLYSDTSGGDTTGLYRVERPDQLT